FSVPRFVHQTNISPLTSPLHNPIHDRNRQFYPRSENILLYHMLLFHLSVSSLFLLQCPIHKGHSSIRNPRLHSNYLQIASSSRQAICLGTHDLGQRSLVG